MNNNNFEIDFRVSPSGNIMDTFAAMKSYQSSGVATKGSCIVFNGVSIPAGYVNDFEDCFGVYETIVSGESSSLNNFISNELTDLEASSFLNACSGEMEKLNRKGLDPAEIDDILIQRNNFKSSGTK